MKIETLRRGSFYHIYNRGNNGGKIFFENENYRYFLQLYKKYIVPISTTYAWCLMQNHFHFLVFLKHENEVKKSELKYTTKPEVSVVDPSRQFSHLFNAYAQAVNKKYSRTGSLLEKPFERKLIDSEEYLKRLVIYIHNNPVHHKVTSTIQSYSWTSYHEFFKSEEGIVQKEEVINLFHDLNNFISCHKLQVNNEPFQGLEP